MSDTLKGRRVMGFFESVGYGLSPHETTPDGRRIDTTLQYFGKEMDQGFPDLKPPFSDLLPDLQNLLLLVGGVLIAGTVFIKSI